MELEQIKSHWQNWASQYKTDLRATTKSGTAKQLEIHALTHALQQFYSPDQSLSILEVGCGNGYNCFALQHAFEQAAITGVDFIEEMVEHAKALNQELHCNIPFYQGNILELDKHTQLAREYDVVYTVRCVINLNNDELQLQGLSQLAQKVKAGGYLLLIENQTHTHAKQNTLRNSVDLPSRKPASFNHFMDEDKLLRHMKSLDFKHVQSHNFSSLHDVILYTLVPMINGGEVDYHHPIVSAATELLCKNDPTIYNAFGEFGQNKLFIFKK